MEDVLIPLVAIVTTMAVPIIAIMAAHQRKMAMLYRQDQLNQPHATLSPEVYQLKLEVTELKQRMDQQAILLDTIADQQRQLAIHLHVPQPEPALKDRLGVEHAS